MKLEKYALAAEIISGVAIVVTLIILIIEVQGNTDVLRAQTINAQYESERQRRDIVVRNDGGIADIIVKSIKGPGELTEVEQFRLARYYTNLLEDFEWQFGEVQAGRLPEERLNVSNWRGMWSQPGLVQRFDARRTNMNPAFVAYWEENVVNARRR
jgi:hypothetical protein